MLSMVLDTMLLCNVNGTVLVGFSTIIFFYPCSELVSVAAVLVAVSL
jgi:hypothetical protein